MSAFHQQQDFPDDIDSSVLFEHFANYCVISREYTDEFDIEDIYVAGGNDLQLDGVAIIVNGVLVNSTDEVDDLAVANKYLDVDYLFIQAKSGANFSGADISNMFFGVRELFSENPTLPRNEVLAKKEIIIKHIYNKSAYFRHGNPRLKLYYVTTGKWTDDNQLVARIHTEISTLDELNIYQSPPVFQPVDARLLQDYFNRSQNALIKTVTFTKKVTLPAMDGVKEAYLGFLPATEYMELITDENKSLLRGLFYENVRDFQGDNLVNKEIQETLNGEYRDTFVLLNNGVTIVAENIRQTGDLFTLSGFQIVNGCQTSHVLYNNQDQITEKILIPIKLIVGPIDELKNLVIKATNRQTVVKTEELSALTDFQKHLEQYYNAIEEGHRLYYERRSQQYRGIPGLEKIRIVNISSQIRSFSSMFLSRAHQASRYYGTLLKDIETRIFMEGHFPIAYYVSSYALFKLEFFFRRRMIDNKYRPFKYHLLGIFRIIVAGIDTPQMTANRFEKYCELIRNVLWDDSKCYDGLKRSCELLDQILGGDFERDKAKDSSIFSKAKDYLEDKSSIFRIEFDGYWRDQNKNGVPLKSGLFCVYECTYDKEEKTISLNKLLYIGGADNVRDRIENHEKYNQWNKQVKSENTLCFTFGEIGSLNRERCKAAMIYKHKPPENTEYKDSFPFDYTKVILSGEIALLTETFSCSPSSFHA